jgi:hypothetical protein
MKVLREFIVVSLSVLIIFVSPAYAQNQTQTQWLTYEDPILGISIKYPSDWEVTQEPNTVIFRHYNETGKSVAIAAVILEPRLENETSEELMKTLMNEFRGDRVLEIHSINSTAIIGGKPAYWVDYNLRDTDIYQNDYFMVDTVNDMMYFLSFNVKEEVYAEYQPIFDKMANSFKVL